MKLLEEKILKDGIIGEGGVLKVDCFLNHQIDVEFICELGREFHRLYKDEGITKILTVEASGIGIACIAAQYFGVPVVFAKKTQSVNISGEVYSAPVESFTHKRHYEIIVSKKFLGPNDKVLIIDDFLAMGSALLGLIKVAEDAGAKIAGAGIVIEKAFQPGGQIIRDKGIRVESLARIAELSENGITFC